MEQLAPKLLNWASTLDVNAREQAEKASRLPFVPGHIALMADAHLGVGATVGSVIPTKGAIIPSAVGVDIGCGMIAVETDLTAADLPDNLKEVMGLIRKRIPAGKGQGHLKQEQDSVLQVGVPFTVLSDRLNTTMKTQYGTLGSGNHFVEVSLDERDRVWVVLHSGSRGIGNQLASRHIETAKGIMKSYFIELEDPALAYFVEGTPEFEAYISDMLWAQRYALGSREIMADNAVRSLFEVVGKGVETRRINCHHNFTQKENHMGHNLWITRKGAIKADVGDLGVIPGSMGTRSYIVKGLGNPASYNSSSHGAGRRLSRGRARDELSVEDLKKSMEGKIWDDRNAEKLLDESPGAYKDIDAVMDDQKDLVEIQHTLHQILNYKGM